MEKEEIKDSIILDLKKAWKEKNNCSYWLEKLPMLQDYDESINNYIEWLKIAIKKQDKSFYDGLINEIVEYYFINQKYYDFN